MLPMRRQLCWLPVRHNSTLDAWMRWWRVSDSSARCRNASCTKHMNMCTGNEIRSFDDKSLLFILRAILLTRRRIVVTIGAGMIMSSPPRHHSNMSETSSARAAPRQVSVRAVSHLVASRHNWLLVQCRCCASCALGRFPPPVLSPRHRASALCTCTQPKAGASPLVATTLMLVPPRRPLRLGGSPRMHRSKPAPAAPPMHAVLRACRAPPGQRARRQLPHRPLPQHGALCPRWLPKASASPVAAPILTNVRKSEALVSQSYVANGPTAALPTSFKRKEEGAVPLLLSSRR
jgi:hypothetical protein